MRPKDVLGRDGEEAAARYLTGAGLVILDRNFRCPQGELDIVARDGDQLVFVEVKTRRTDVCGPPVAAVTARKVRRVRAAAAAWLRAHGPHRGDLRFDVISVRPGPVGELAVEHLRAAF